MSYTCSDDNIIKTWNTNGWILMMIVTIRLTIKIIHLNYYTITAIYTHAHNIFTQKWAIPIFWDEGNTFVMRSSKMSLYTRIKWVLFPISMYASYLELYFVEKIQYQRVPTHFFLSHHICPDLMFATFFKDSPRVQNSANDVTHRFDSVHTIIVSFTVWLKFTWYNSNFMRLLN